MSKAEFKRLVVGWLFTQTAAKRQIETITAHEAAVQFRVPVKLAKRALKELRRSGQVFRCPCCGCYSLEDHLLP